MTTRLKKPVKREVMSSYGTLIVTLAPAGVLIRQKGHRTTYGPISYGSLFQSGAQMHAAAQIMEKLSKRKSGKSKRAKRGLLSVGV